MGTGGGGVRGGGGTTGLTHGHRDLRKLVVGS